MGREEVRFSESWRRVNLCGGKRLGLVRVGEGLICVGGRS